MVKFYLVLLLIFLLLLGCSKNIKSIIEYKNVNNEFVKNRVIEFDRNGNKTREENFGNSRSDRIVTSEYKNNIKLFERQCDFFKSHDTCVTRSFSKFKLDKKTGQLIQTLFEADSSTRLIRKIKQVNDYKISKTYSWEFNPSKKPKRENALVLTDTIYFDNKGRKQKILHYNSKYKKPWIELFTYSKDSYSIKTLGTAFDTIIQLKISPLQKVVDKGNIDFRFNSDQNFKYEIIKY